MEKLKQLKQKEDNQIDSAGQHIAAAELELVRHEVNNMDIVRSLSDALECGKYSSEGAAREWSTVVTVIVIFISWFLF